jgi:hypothetical protein
MERPFCGPPESFGAGRIQPHIITCKSNYGERALADVFSVPRWRFWSTVVGPSLGYEGIMGIRTHSGFYPRNVRLRW